MVTWERHAYPGGLDTNERLEWFRNIIGDYFDVSHESAGVQNWLVDVFRTKEKYHSLDGSFFEIHSMRTVDGSQPTRLGYGFANDSNDGDPVYLVTGGTTKTPIISRNYIVRHTYFEPSEANSAFYVDTMQGTGWFAVRFAYEFVKGYVTFLFTEAKDVDGGDANYVFCFGRRISTNITAAAWIPNSLHFFGVTSAATTSVINNNLTNPSGMNDISSARYSYVNTRVTGKYFIRPFYLLSGNTNLYFIDGGSANLNPDTHFVMNGQEWYHIGLNLCVKVG
ncbi:MAG: hypothetical protein J6M07_01210 [Ruminococcus sp.]|nr:hypothetical protein [Ruminococcus sp.]MBQ5316667.1 hypothetical protein [Oscillospiraceae bacterium]